MLAERSAKGPASLNAFSQGATALLAAPKKKFGFIPYFDQQKVDIALKHFHQAFNTSIETADQNQYAFFLGKAYLMKAKPDSAKHWFQWVATESPATNYKTEAKWYLEKLP